MVVTKKENVIKEDIAKHTASLVNLKNILYQAENNMATKKEMEDYIKSLIKQIIIYQMKIVDLEIILEQAKREIKEM